MRRSVDREVEPLEQCPALAVTETTQTTGGCDLQLGDDLLGLDLADLGQGLEQRRDLHLAQDLVALGGLEHLLEVGTAALQALFELSPGTTGRSRLLQSSSTLLIGQLGKGHNSSVSFVYV